MSPTAVPTRITIDFRDAIHPSRSWILGLDPEPAGRADLLAFDDSAPIETTRRTMRAIPLRAIPRPRPTALLAECACPEFCERDHANE